MLTRLSIRDIVLIDRLDIDCASGLSALTGETGAGKSILLDAFALALGARGDSTLVRQGRSRAGDGGLRHRRRPPGPLAARRQRYRHRGRTDPAPGPTRRRAHARLHQRPAGRRAGAQEPGGALVEIHGQHDDRALVDAGTHRRLLDAYGALEAQAAEVERLWAQRRTSEEAVAAHRAEVERAAREADWLRHAVEELTRLAPEAGEETALAAVARR